MTVSPNTAVHPQAARNLAGPERLASVWAPRMLSVLRIVAALLFMQHGMQKLFGFPPSPGHPAMFTLLWFAAIIELIGGVLVLVGLFTRPLAFLMSGEMAFAYFISHAPRNFFPVINGGDAPILYCFVFLYIAVVGAGIWSLDALKQGHARRL